MKVSYDVRGVESQGDRPLVKAGVYRIKVTEAPITQPEGKGVRWEIHPQIVGGDYDGLDLRISYVNLDREDLNWKVRQVVDAFGLKESGSFDDKTLVGKECEARVKSKMDEEWGPQNEIATFLPKDGGEAAEVEEAEDEEPEAGTEEESEGEFTWADLTEMDRDALKAFIKEAELGTLKDLGIVKSTTDEQIQDIIAEALELGDRPSDDEEEEDEAEAEEAEDEEEAEAEEESDGLDDLDRTEIKKLLKAEVPDFKVLKSMTDDDLRAALRGARGTGGSDEEEEEEPTEAPNYKAMSVGDLRTLARERSLSDKGAKDVLVKRLEKDDEPF